MKVIHPLEVLTKKYFIGIDESNHGRYPEIYVAVFSDRQTDILKYKQIKKRKAHNTIESILRDRDYRFLLVEKKHVEKLGPHAIKSSIISTLVLSFDRNIKETHVIIDGEEKNCLRYDISYIVSKELKQRVSQENFVFVKNADILFPIVNKADEIANIIYRYYRRFKFLRTLTKYDNKKVELNI